ncbi:MULTISPECIES: hypothetical protein [Nonomuraea]|uniref:Uncharacterized protein n=1 Tax=Nonomuraea salmonea TaxID=46181 RepID=A0ABV5NH45_9ACTN
MPPKPPEPKANAPAAIIAGVLAAIVAAIVAAIAANMRSYPRP